MYGSSNCSACQCYVVFWGESCDNVCPCWLGADCAVLPSDMSRVLPSDMSRVLPSDMSRVSSDYRVAAQWRGHSTVTVLDETTFELTKYSVHRVFDIHSKFVVWTRALSDIGGTGEAF